MRVDQRSNRLLISEKEFRLISFAVATFSMASNEWQYDSVENKDEFKKEFLDRFNFSLMELCYVNYEFYELEENTECYKAPEICIYLSERIPQKLLILYVAVAECINNYDYYEIYTSARITKDQLRTLLSDFKKLFPELADKMN